MSFAVSHCTSIDRFIIIQLEEVWKNSYTMYCDYVAELGLILTNRSDMSYFGKSDNFDSISLKSQRP